MNAVLQLLGYALIPAMALTLAEVWAILRAPNENWRSALMHFAAGVVFAVVAVEFLPDLVHEHSVLATAVGFTLGTAAMLGVRMWSEQGIKKTIEKSQTASGSLIVATAVDISVDGLMLGIGFAAGAKQGILLTIALAFELITLGWQLRWNLNKVGGHGVGSSPVSLVYPDYLSSVLLLEARRFHWLVGLFLRV